MEWNKEGSNAVTRQMSLVEELLLFEDPVANAFQPWLTIVFGHRENPPVLGQGRPRVRNEIGASPDHWAVILMLLPSVPHRRLCSADLLQTLISRWFFPLSARGNSNDGRLSVINHENDTGASGRAAVRTAIAGNARRRFIDLSFA
jgi:hypothetical protein